MTQRRLSIALLVATCLALTATTEARASSDLTRLAQAQPAPAATPALEQTPAPAATPDAAAPAAAVQPAAEEPIGNVATLTGSATVTRNKATTTLQIKDDIYANDVVATAAKSSLGITFNDATTFKLSANARITIDSYVYEEGGKENVGLFDVARGTLAFVAAGVAKSGDMKITTPTATLGIRGTTGLITVPEGATPSSNNVAIKLYPDADGRVGQIEIADRSGLRLGALTRGASGFTIRPGGLGGARFAAVPLAISPQQVLRDQGFVRQLFSAQTLGRRVVDEQRAFRRANPNLLPNRGNAPGQTAPQPQNGLPGQNRTAPQIPGQPNRPGQQPGTPGRQGAQQPPGAPQQTQTPQGGQAGGRPGRHSLPGQPGGAPLPQTGQQPGSAPKDGLPPRPNQQLPGATTPAGAKPPTRPQQGLPRPDVTPPPGVPQRGGQPPIGAPPALRRPVTPPPAVAPPAMPQPGQPPALQQSPRQGALPQRLPGLQQRPGLQPRPALQPPRRAPPNEDKRRRIF